MDHEQWMVTALHQAEIAAAAGEVPVGAVIVREDEILASAHNECELRQDATAHAEFLALRAAIGSQGYQRLIGATVYCTLEPCCMCAGALLLARVERVVFAARDPKFGGVRSLARILDLPAANHRVEVVEGVLAARSSGLLKTFFRHLRGEDSPLQPDL